jgi:hypothetical protein
MKRDRGLAMLRCAAVLVLAGCAGSLATTRLDGRLVIEAEPSHGSFAVDSPIVKKADAQITALVGHPVVFRFDAALVPRWQDRLEELSEAGIDGIAHDLVTLEERHPTLFAWMAPKLRQVEWDYSAIDEYPRFTFDPDGGALRMVLVSTHAWEVEESDRLTFAFGRAYGKALGARFASLGSAAVPDAERAAYAEWLLDFAYGAFKDGAHGGPNDEAVDAPRARVLSLLLAFASATAGKDARLDAQLRARILDEAAYVAQTRHNQADVVARLPPGHEFLRAEAALSAWLQASEGALSDADRLRVATIIVESSDDDGSVHAFAGFDDVAYTLQVLDQWTAAGKPTSATRDGDGARMELFALVIGARQPADDDTTGCAATRWPLYRRMQRDDVLRLRVFDAIFAKKDPVVEKTLMGNLLGASPIQTALAFWHASEGDDAAFRATTHALAGYTGHCRASRELYDELPQMWRAYPQRRPLLAYLAYQYATDAYRDNFTRVFSPLTQSEFAGFLDEHPDPLRQLHYVWPELGGGWSRMDVLGPRLDAWLASDRYKDASFAGEILDAVARDLCAEGSTRDLARLHDWIGQRGRAHPSEMPGLHLASARSEPGACKTEAPPTAKPAPARPRTSRDGSLL